jgi:hypothetical protein
MPSFLANIFVRFAGASTSKARPMTTPDNSPRDLNQGEPVNGQLNNCALLLRRNRLQVERNVTNKSENTMSEFSNTLSQKPLELSN